VQIVLSAKIPLYFEPSAKNFVPMRSGQGVNGGCCATALSLAMLRTQSGVSGT